MHCLCAGLQQAEAACKVSSLPGLAQAQCKEGGELQPTAR